jgi:hypothetical protein
VVKGTKGSYPEFIVPWREGTALRAARRDDLLKILVPIRRFVALIDELTFNLEVAKAAKTIDHLGALFREDEFHQALRDGVLSTLPSEVRKLIADAYISMNRANRLVMAVLSVPSQHQQPLQFRQAHSAVTGCLPLNTTCPRETIAVLVCFLTPFDKPPHSSSQTQPSPRHECPSRDRR